MTFVKPHCRVLAANISEMVVSTEQFLDAWHDMTVSGVKRWFKEMEGNYVALPGDIRDKLAHDMANLTNEVDRLEKVTDWGRRDFVERYSRDLQKTALSEGIVQVAACQSD